MNITDSFPTFNLPDNFSFEIPDLGSRPPLPPPIDVIGQIGNDATDDAISDFDDILNAPAPTTSDDIEAGEDPTGTPASDPLADVIAALESDDQAMIDLALG